MWKWVQVQINYFRLHLMSICKSKQFVADKGFILIIFAGKKCFFNVLLGDWRSKIVCLAFADRKNVCWAFADRKMFC